MASEVACFELVIDGSTVPQAKSAFVLLLFSSIIELNQ
jgi:hypothetical protein